MVGQALAKAAPEYRAEYREVGRAAARLATDLLGCCNNSREVNCSVPLLHTKNCCCVKVCWLLAEQAGASGLLRRSAGIKFPRLRLAVETGQREFVAHMHSQQVGGGRGEVVQYSAGAATTVGWQHRLAPQISARKVASRGRPDISYPSPLSCLHHQNCRQTLYW